MPPFCMGNINKKRREIEESIEDIISVGKKAREVRATSRCRNGYNLSKSKRTLCRRDGVLVRALAGKGDDHQGIAAFPTHAWGLA